MLTYGFYNSINHDRVYDATQMSSLFNGIINDGIFMSVGNHMLVTASEGMNILVGSGRAWFDGTWTNNDAAYTLEVKASDMILDRIDAVVLEVDSSSSVRANSFKIVKGTAASSPAYPTLTNTDTVHQHVLAYIKVNADTDEITQANITNMVGTTNTPFVTGILKTFDASDLIKQWNSNFDTWFENVKTQLSGDVAGNLQNEIDNLQQEIDTLAIIQEITSTEYNQNASTYAATDILYAIKD